MGCVSGCACRTVIEGDAYAVSNRSGNVKVIEGPARLWRCNNYFTKLDIVVAGEDEYLVVKFRDGRTELRPGPASVVPHPVDHISVGCEQALRIGEQEMIVVYRKEESGKQSSLGGSASVKRTIVKGPGIYVPQSVSEWTHEFSWTGNLDDARGDVAGPARKRPNALKFQKLRTSPSKMYYDVEMVRTKDNALLTLKLMIFFNYTKIEQMLDNTGDPFGDLINAASADVIEWCSVKKFDDFLAATDVLNTPEPYKQLYTSALQIGLTIDKVVFRGYNAPDGLQRMHDGAIEKRTKLGLARETEEEEQKMEDMKLDKETERASRKAQLEMDKLNHELAMTNKSAEAERQKMKEEHTVQLDRLRALKALDRNLDIGKYITSVEGRHPPVVMCGTMQSGITTASTDTRSFPWLQL